MGVGNWTPNWGATQNRGDVAEPKGRVLKGVIVNAQRDDVGREIDVDGVPTRVVSKITEL
ncbi:hypothetical protein XacyCFBP2565_22105 [Xanthomonas arboricola pv. corylina]|nr:hypothetical protein XacyCFBP2565_22105 [Xanthomonas arboricola pv. corylina]